MQFRSQFHFGTAWLLAMLLALTPRAEAQPDSTALEVQYFDALRLRGLHTLAEDFAASQLRSPRLTPERRVQLTLELARTILDHGERVEGEQRDELWGESERVLNGLLNTATSGFGALAARTELAMIPAARAAATAWRAQLDPDDQSLREPALAELSQAQAALNLVLELVLREQSTMSDRPRSPQRGLEKELATLSQRLRFKLAEVALSTAELSAGAQRASRLIAAGDQLRELLSSRPAPGMQLDAKVLLAGVLRRLLDFRSAEEALAGISQAGLEVRQQDRLLAERVRIQAANGQTDQALQGVVDRIRGTEIPTDEFRAAAVAVLLSAHDLAVSKKQNELAGQLLNEARVQAANAGGRWGQMAVVTLARAEESGELGAELARIVGQARNQFSRGELQASAELYAAAANAARQRNLPDRAIEFALTRGSILLQAQNWAAAETAFADLVNLDPANGRAPDADLLRLYAVGKQEEAAGGETSRFEAGLREHITRYESSPTRGEAAWMLAALQERREDFSRAISTYRSISPEHPRGAAAQARFVELYTRVLNDLAQTGADSSAWRSAAARDAALIGGKLLEVSTAWSLEQCRTGLACASLLLRLQREQTPLASRLIALVQDRILLEARRAQAEGTGISADWAAVDLRATRLALLALLHQDKVAEAQRILARMDEDPDALLAFLNSLHEASQEIEPAQRVAFGSLMQSAIRRLERRRSNLTPEQQRRLDEAGVRAAQFVGDLALAASLLQGLLVDTPQDRELLRQLIDVSVRRGQAEDLRRARAAWTRLEQMEQPGAPGWLQARVSTAELDVRLSDPLAARRTLILLRTLYPELGGPELKARADALWEKLQSQ